MKTFISLFLCCAVYASSYGQSSYNQNGRYNRLGLQGKYAALTLDSDNLEVEGGNGFLGGFTTRGRLYNNWGVVYGIDFLSINAEIGTSGPNGLQDEQTRFNLLGAQLNLLASYNLIGQNLAIDIGPALLVNGNLSLDDRSQGSNIVNGYTTLTAEEVQEVSRINPFGVIALTGGWESVRFTLQYQYGLTNFFGNLNDQDFTDPLASGTDFDATVSILSGGIVFYL